MIGTFFCVTERNVNGEKKIFVLWPNYHKPDCIITPVTQDIYHHQPPEVCLNQPEQEIV